MEQRRIAACNLSELHLTLGEVSAAARAAEQGVELADRSSRWQQQVTSRATHADALHQCGRPLEATSLFEEAEMMQRKRQPKFAMLYSLRGFQYCDFLLSELEGGVWNLLGDVNAANVIPHDGRAIAHAVKKRAAHAIEWSGENLLDIALGHLMFGQAYRLEASIGSLSAESVIQNEGNGAAIQLAEEHFAAAVAGLRAAGAQEFIARGLLARAGFRVSRHRWDEAEADLNEAWGIADRGSMRLHMADAHLMWTRLHFLRNRQNQGESDLNAARSHLEETDALIQQTGYHRRDAELAGLQTALAAAGASPTQ